MKMTKEDAKRLYMEHVKWLDQKVGDFKHQVESLVKLAGKIIEKEDKEGEEKTLDDLENEIASL